MRRTLSGCGWLLLLALPAAGRAETAWLAAEAQAQEARWAAQQGHSPAPPPARVQPHPVRPSSTAIVTRPPLVARYTSRRPVQRPPAAGRPRTPDEVALAQLIRDQAQRHRIDPLLVKAVILAESAGRRDATSPKGALGLMQLMPATARRFGVTDPYDPAQNVAGGTRYLRWLLDRFDGDATRALAGYNAGEGAVDRHGGVPPYRETRNYVRVVQSNHRFLKRRVAERQASTGRNDPIGRPP